MKKIFAIGESLIDIIFRDGQPQAAKPGGSMLNSSVSLGRAGLPVYLITEYAKDNVGDLIDRFLRENNVSTDHISRYDNGKTSLAMAFLDENNNARYTFYKDYPPERMKIRVPSITKDDILLYGSIYSVTSGIRTFFSKVLEKAAEKDAMLIYDPNFRAAHLKELQALKPMIMENIRAASLIRGSDEDFRNIFKTTGPDDTWAKIRKYCSCLIYTENSKGVHVKTPSVSAIYPVKKITPVSTIGAGDNFNAGLIASFYSDNIGRSDLNTLGSQEWGRYISVAVEFASNVCLSYENYIDGAFARMYRSASRFQI